MSNSVYIVQEHKTYDEYSITSVHDLAAFTSKESALNRITLLEHMMSDSEREITKYVITEIPLIVTNY